MPKLAVTGVTGNLGRIAAEDLLLRDPEPFRPTRDV
jgi:hypothetical protein